MSRHKNHGSLSGPPFNLEARVFQLPIDHFDDRKTEFVLHLHLRRADALRKGRARLPEDLLPEARPRQMRRSSVGRVSGLPPPTPTEMLARARHHEVHGQGERDPATLRSQNVKTLSPNRG